MTLTGSNSKRRKETQRTDQGSNLCSLGEQSWRSDESACLPTMCPGFDSWTRRHSAPGGFSADTLGFPSPPKAITKQMRIAFDTRLKITLLSWLPVSLATATLMYKVKNNLVPSCLSRLFETKNPQCCLGNWDFEIARFNTTSYGKHTVRYQGPYIWSKLRKELRTSPTIAIFKTRIRKIDLSDLIDNNRSCCKLCKSWTELFLISFSFHFIFHLLNTVTCS